MKKNMNDLIAKDEKELKEMAKLKKDELLNLVLDNKMNKLKNPRTIFHTRKEIARILTVLREKQLLANKEEAK